MSDDNVVTGGITGALAAIVALFVWLVKRGKGGKSEEEPLTDRIAKAVACIEHEEIDLPENWRRFVDGRIAHQLNNRRAVLFAVIGLLERGHPERALTILREEAEDLKQ